jgi:ribosomal protein L37E
VSPTKYPRQTRARTLIHAAIRRGDVARRPCEVCGTEPAQAHHHDYDKPLDVQWLCRRHHDIEHDTLQRGPSNTAMLVYNQQAGRETWEAFKERCAEAGYGSVRQAIYTLIEHIILHGFPVKPPKLQTAKKDKPDA